MAKLDRDGVKIHYEVHGKGPTILLSHGYSSTSRMWDDQVTALNEREDRLRGLKLRVPVEGLRIKLVPDEAELEQCCTLGESLARHLTGQLEHRELDMANLA